MICVSIDKDNDQLLSLEEIKDAYDNIAVFSNRLSLMNLKRKDIDTIFKILDVDHSGDVNYKEFVNHLYGLEANSVNLLFAKVELAYKEIKNDMNGLLSMLDGHEKDLEDNSQQLARINKKLARLSSLPKEVDNCSNTDEAREQAVASKRSRREENLDLSSFATPADVSEELTRLQERMQDLSVLRWEVSRRAESQGEMLQQNLEMLSFARNGAAVPRGKFSRLTEQVRVLQCQVFHQLPAALDNLQKQVSHEGVLLEESNYILAALDELQPSERRKQEAAMDRDLSDHVASGLNAVSL